MKKLVFAGLMALAFAGPAFADDAANPPAAVQAASTAQVVVPVRNELLVTAQGSRVGNVLSINTDGSPNVIADQRIVAIPAATLTRVDGRLTTSLTRTEVRRLD